MTGSTVVTVFSDSDRQYSVQRDKSATHSPESMGRRREERAERVGLQQLRRGYTPHPSPPGQQ